MPLTPEERESFRAEGLDPVRREHFRQLEAVPMPALSLDEYLRFLQDIQKAFGPMTVSGEIPETRFNRL